MFVNTQLTDISKRLAELTANNLVSQDTRSWLWWVFSGVGTIDHLIDGPTVMLMGVIEGNG